MGIERGSKSGLNQFSLFGLESKPEFVKSQKVGFISYLEASLKRNHKDLENNNNLGEHMIVN